MTLTKTTDRNFHILTRKFNGLMDNKKKELSLKDHINNKFFYLDILTCKLLELSLTCNS